MTAHAVFSLQNSEFNEFLFAQIGAERNDSLLTVLSALARLGLDPWQEAARLSRQTTEAAIESLSAIIAALPNGQWARSEAPMIAARLVALLPAGSPSAGRTRAPARRDRTRITRLGLVLICACLCATAIIIVASRRPAPEYGQTEISRSTAPAPPQAPFSAPK
ncbi:MAG TPA: hypothetical protein VN802_03310 [Stellaceae bacterium]|nr:hypothetical protein [Stellaceae bacterium]